VVYFRNSNNNIVSGGVVHDSPTLIFKIYLGNATHIYKNNEIYNSGLNNVINGAGNGFWISPGSGGSNIIEFNYIHDIGGVKYDHAVYDLAGSNIIRYNLMENLLGRALYTVASNNSFYYNIVKNASTGIGIGNGSDGNFVYNNVFYNVDKPIQTLFGSTGVTVKNNIFAIVPTRIYDIQSTAGVIIDYNLIDSWVISQWGGVWCTYWANWKSVSSQDAHSISSNLLFVNAGTDFHLQSGSPAIDNGTNVGLTRDYSGSIVPQGLAPDIGAYEYTSATPCIHKSDTNCDGCVSGTELTAFIDLWYVDSSNPTLKELMEAIGLWKRGC
jgi:hypothetical protein